jgi:glutamate/tyrosine decarboxylase-like PLP-dependent enzyme
MANQLLSMSFQMTGVDCPRFMQGRRDFQTMRDREMPAGDSRTVAPAANGSLDPNDWSEFREQAHRMLDDMLDYTENIRKRPVWQAIPDEVRALFRQDLPEQPTALARVHEEFMNAILPYTARNAHPGFLGWVQGGGTPVGMLAEMLAAGLNANTGGRDQIPVDVERQVTQWVRTLFHFPAGASGLFVTGTSIANFIAVIVARDVRLGCEVRRRGIVQHPLKLTAYASIAVHGSMGRALDFAGLGSESLRLIATDQRGRMDLDALTQTIAADRAAGFTPFMVIGTAGTVNTGAIDDLSGIARLCAQEELWFHVDGAVGALAMLCPELAPRLQGIEQANSLAFDFHKWGQVPYDAGFILVRDGDLHRQAFASSAAYLHREERGMSGGSPWPCDFGPDLSRGFRALKTWTTLKVHGTHAIGEAIRRSCELARYLESRIAVAPELELMASVELNIVCFRYRFAATEERCNQLNRTIVIALHESGAVAPSTTVIGSRVVIRAAFVNHRTSRAEIDTLITAVLAAGKALGQAAVVVKQEESEGQIWQRRDARVRQLDEELLASDTMQKDCEIALRYERATLLAQMGRNLEARSDHLRVLALDASHHSNLINLGRILVLTGRLKAAQMVYAEAVKKRPEDIVGRINLGSVLLEREDPAGAREQYEAALRIDPDSPQAHGGMYYSLARLGEAEAAEAHQRIAFGRQNLIPLPYRGASQPIPVLLLVSSTGGNTPIEKLLDDRVFQTYIVVTDFYDRATPLPNHQLVVNGIGDVDVSDVALVAAESLLPFTSAPVLNLPSAVRATSRCENAHRLRDLPGVVTAATASFSRAALSAADAVTALYRQGFTFPLLLRAPGYHMGQHFERVESPERLAEAVAALPGDELLVIEYLDAQGSDGCSRKYRVMMVDGQLYPLHVAISPHWKIHYFSADMADRSDHRAEDERFLTDMASVLDPKAMAALEHLRVALGLDYAGVDFGLSQHGEILLFEANATMIVQQPDEGAHWDYRRPAVERIHAAVHRMLMTRAGALIA